MLFSIYTAMMNSFCILSYVINSLRVNWENNFIYLFIYDLFIYGLLYDTANISDIIASNIRKIRNDELEKNMEGSYVP
jgi:hypothetical protein